MSSKWPFAIFEDDLCEECNIVDCDVYYICSIVYIESFTHGLMVYTPHYEELHSIYEYSIQLGTCATK